MPSKIRQLVVRTREHQSIRGQINFANLSIRCAFGRCGLVVRKKEGDGGTPVGSFPMLYGLYRQDRGLRPHSAVPFRPLVPTDGWCDEPKDRNYNRPVRHPYPASAERLWREDNLYDICVVLGHNHRPRVKGRGSAIFFHLASSDYNPTEGCIAVSRGDMLRLLAMVKPGDLITIG